MAENKKVKKISVFHDTLALIIILLAISIVIRADIFYLIIVMMGIVVLSNYMERTKTAKTKKILVLRIVFVLIIISLIISAAIIAKPWYGIIVIFGIAVSLLVNPIIEYKKKRYKLYGRFYPK